MLPQIYLHLNTWSWYNSGCVLRPQNAINVHYINLQHKETIPTRLGFLDFIRHRWFLYKKKTSPRFGLTSDNNGSEPYGFLDTSTFGYNNLSDLLRKGMVGILFQKLQPETWIYKWSVVVSSLQWDLSRTTKHLTNQPQIWLVTLQQNPNSR